MTSLTQTRYGSRSARHGRSRRWRSNQASSFRRRPARVRAGGSGGFKGAGGKHGRGGGQSPETAPTKYTRGSIIDYFMSKSNGGFAPEATTTSRPLVFSFR